MACPAFRNCAIGRLCRSRWPSSPRHRASSPPFARATSSCTIPMNRLVRWSISSKRPPRTRGCWPSSRRSIGPAAIPPVVRALAQAADNGKQVTAVIELKARLDEERNILWARELEKSGVHVVFGFIGLKTHCKVALVVRREEDGIRRYVHLATGNYNPQTARLYTDLGFFTCNPEFCEDASALFNYLTGYCELPQWRKLIVAPSRMQSFMLEKIRQETSQPAGGQDGPHHRQDQWPARAGRGAIALQGQPGRREDRPHLPRHLRAAAAIAGHQREHPRLFHRGSVSSSIAGSFISTITAIRRSTLARRIGWTGTSAGASKSSFPWKRRN